MPILGSSNSAANKDMMSKYGQMGIQLSGLVENIVGKEEIARHEQFLLFPQCFQNLSVVDASNEYLWSKALRKVSEHGPRADSCYIIIIIYVLHSEDSQRKLLTKINP